MSEPKVADHFRDDIVNLEDVKIGEIIDMEAGLFLRKNKNDWTQIDGGYGLTVSEEDVKGWLDL
jgi:hypothetical protein